MRIKIIIEINDSDLTDEGHTTGLSNKGYEKVFSSLRSVGEIYDISIAEEEDD